MIKHKTAIRNKRKEKKIEMKYIALKKTRGIINNKPRHSLVIISSKARQRVTLFKS